MVLAAAELIRARPKVPRMMSNETLTLQDVTIRSTDGMPLRAWYWPRPDPAGIVVISHGIGEHAGCYRHVAEELSPRLDVDILAFDYRGHGRSPGRRGVVAKYEDLLGDLQGVFRWVEQECRDRPTFGLGHSNGGQVLLRALLDGLKIDGAILSNPCLRLALRVPPHKRLIGELLRRFAPGVTLSGELFDEQMTRDPAMRVGRRDDPLRHNQISAPVFFGMVEGGPRVVARAAEIHTPVLMLLGLSDPVVDPEYSREFFAKLGSSDKTLRPYPHAVHEPLNDLDRAQVLDDIVNWVSPRVRKD
jgi:alpha-beta hydrolase superfamily lysophospholipase